MRRIAIALLLAFGLLLPGVTSALGHAELRSARPGPGDTISELPTALVARFTQDLRKDRTSIELRDGNGARVARGGKDPDRARAQVLPLPEQLEPGKYEVRWVTFSAEDDEIARGKYRFTVKAPAATAVPAPTQVACASPVPTLVPNASAAPTTSDDPGETASMEPVESIALGSSPAPEPSPDPAQSMAPEVGPEPCAPALSVDGESAAGSTAAEEESPAP